MASNHKQSGHKNNDPFDRFIHLIIDIAQHPRSNLNIVDKILNKHPDFINRLSYYQSDDYSPLHIALRHRADHNLLIYLIRHGADVNLPSTKYGTTPLISASTVDSTMILLYYGADVNQQSKSGGTALMNACMSGKSEDIIPILLRAGADVNLESNSGETALLYALQYGAPPNVIKQLISAGADVHHENDRGETPIYIATQKGSPSERNETIGMLLTAGADADINRKTKNGYTPIVESIIRGEPKIVKKLLDAGADPNIVDQHGITPLMYVSKAAGILPPHINRSLVKLLVDNGAHVDLQDMNGRTALMYAVVNRKSDIVEYLLSIGAETQILNKEGKNAANYSRSSHIKELLRSQAPQNGGHLRKRCSMKKNKKRGKCEKRGKTRRC